MPTLYSRLIAVLERDWPSTLEAWQKVQDVIQERLLHDRAVTWPARKGIDDLYTNPGTPHPTRTARVANVVYVEVPVMRLSQELGIENILPLALYELQKFWSARSMRD